MGLPTQCLGWLICISGSPRLRSARGQGQGQGGGRLAPAGKSSPPGHQGHQLHRRPAPPAVSYPRPGWCPSLPSTALLPGHPSPQEPPAVRMTVSRPWAPQTPGQAHPVRSCPAPRTALHVEEAQRRPRPLLRRARSAASRTGSAGRGPGVGGQAWTRVAPSGASGLPAACRGARAGTGPARGPGVTCGTFAQELVDLVQAAAVLQAGAAGTLVAVHLAVDALVAWGRRMRRERAASPRPGGRLRPPTGDSPAAPTPGPAPCCARRPSSPTPPRSNPP